MDVIEGIDENGLKYACRKELCVCGVREKKEVQKKATREFCRRRREARTRVCDWKVQLQLLRLGRVAITKMPVAPASAMP